MGCSFREGRLAFARDQQFCCAALLHVCMYAQIRRIDVLLVRWLCFICKCFVWFQNKPDVPTSPELAVRPHPPSKTSPAPDTSAAAAVDPVGLHHLNVSIARRPRVPANISEPGVAKYSHRPPAVCSSHPASARVTSALTLGKSLRRARLLTQSVASRDFVVQTSPQDYARLLVEA